MVDNYFKFPVRLNGLMMSPVLLHRLQYHYFCHQFGLMLNRDRSPYCCFRHRGSDFSPGGHLSTCFTMHVHNNRRFGVDKIKIITRLGEITIKIMVLIKDSHWVARIDPWHIREFSKGWYVFHLKSRNWVIAVINHIVEIFGRHFGLSERLFYLYLCQ